MADPADLLIVGGHAIFDGASTVSPTATLTAGIIEVAGDFIQYNTTSDESFVSTGTRVILSGGVQ